MGLLGGPNGGSFFVLPEPASGIPFEGLHLNVLRSSRFSYMMMRALRSTTRALKNLDFSRDEGMGNGTGWGRYSWRAAGTVGGGKVDRIGIGGSSSYRVRVGRYSGGRSGGGVRNGRGGPGRRARCTGDNLGNIARGEGKVQRKEGGTGATEGEGKCRGDEWTQGGKGVTGGNGECKGRRGNQCGNGGEQIGDMNLNMNALTPDGANGAFLGEDVTAIGVPSGESRVPADKAVASKFSKGTVNRTLSVAGFGATDSISNQLTPMKGFMKSVKMATGVVSGVKTATGVIQKFQAPAGGVLIGFGAANGVVLGFETARMIVKGAKISKDFVSVWQSTRNQIGVLGRSDAALAKATREKLWKGVKFSDGALTLVRLTKDYGAGLGGSLQDGLSSWDLVTKSYDASNSVLKVFEAALGLKGGGMIGMVGKGFTVLKGAVGGLGVSVKLVKAVAISKETSIVLLKGFGISKTVTKAFKATQEGKKFVKWLIFKHGSKDPAGGNFQKVSTITPRRGREFELFMTFTQQAAAAARHGNSSSLMYSLASLLLAKHEAFDVGDPDEDELISSNFLPLYIFSLSFPS